MNRSEQTYCVLVPAYREQGRIADVVREIRAQGADVVVVDDGSDDATANEAEAVGATVLRHTENRGKGVALETGFKHVREAGYGFVITLDADGQHDPAGIPMFVDAYRTGDVQVIVGDRMAEAGDMPFVRRCTNRFMSWLLSREMGQNVADTQCGYRLYAAEVLPWVRAESEGFAAESEVLLNLAQRGVGIGAVPVRVIYRDEKSKINPVRDTIRFFGMLRRYRRRQEAGQE